MIHFFDTEIAEAYGVNCAVIFNHIYYWCLKNEANGRNCFNGKYWTYNSVTALDKLFPYLSRKQIRTALDKLRDAGMTEEGVFNEDPRDRTKWYTISEKGMLHFHNKANVLAPEGKCYSNNTSTYNRTTDNKPNNNTYGDSAENASSPEGSGAHPTDVEDIDKFFNGVWALYPRKKGKGSVSKTQKKKLQRIGYDQLSRCIDRYKAFVEEKGLEERYIMYGSTFFNSGYVDYLDENYSESDYVVTEKKEGGWE